jgi:hypothetical protein
MAIIVEQEKKKINWFAMLLTIFLVAVVGGAIYYFFFVAPPLLDKIVPSSLQSLKDLSSAQINPETVLNSPDFQKMRQYVNPIEIGAVGKLNPFSR